ncbi:hypothetical protein ACIQ1D_18725 [Lysinibacillus xylanilyticus]|uniref:hypothetical protein n=1 Tax=Lysinibacillus xylanilyticus TaxID=582475 RepID=UPI0037F133BC
MTASFNDIGRWLEEGKMKGATHVIVARDTWDNENYPVYVLPSDDVKEVVDGYAKKQDRVEEVYNLSMDIEEQLSSTRAMNL